MNGLAVPGSKKRQGLSLRLSSVPITLRIRKMCPLRLIRCDDSGGDDDGGNSAADCIYSLEVRNNMNIDSRHTDSSERTGADSIRRDNNLGTSENRSSRSEIRNSVPQFWEPGPLSWPERHHAVLGSRPAHLSPMRLREIF